VLNTIFAEALDDICTRLEEDVEAGKDFNESLQTVLSDIVKKHKRILFNGDNYSKEWHKEAGKRGLPNLKDTPSSLGEVKKKDIISLFEKHSVLSKSELLSRYEIYKEQYERTIHIEASVALTMAKTMIIPAALAYQSFVAKTIGEVSECDCSPTNAKALLKEICGLTEKALKQAKDLGKSIDKGSSSDMIKAMVKLRETVDELEGLIPSDKWPLPSYAEMLFRM
jgi:glutamine synthetase